METEVKAVFYRYKYYIFPEEFSDLKKIRNGDKIKAKRLKEERCMAPDFIYESVAEEIVEIDNVNLLFPVTVTLRSGKEYDALLSKQIDRICPGCSNYTPSNDGNLEGHHREISLDGVCYERVTAGDKPTFAQRSYWFLCAIANHADKIKKCIDAGKTKRLNKLCRSFNYIPVPYKFYGDKQNGKYRLFWRSFGTEHIDLLLQCFAAKAATLESSPLKGYGLEILPYIPKDANVDLGNFDENAPMFSVTEARFPDIFDVHVYSAKRLNAKKYDKLLCDVHNNLCRKLGEAAVIRTVSGYDVVYDAPEKLLTLTQLAELLAKNVEENISFPVSFPVWWEKQEKALYGRRNFEGITACYPLSALACDSSNIAETDFYGCLSYAYVFIPAKVENFEKIISTVIEYASTCNDIPEPVLYKENNIGCFVPVGAGACTFDSEEGPDKEPKGEEGVAVDFLVTDENGFYRYIKILAPVLRFYNARLVVVNGSGVNEYRSGYKIVPVDNADMH